MQDHAVGEEAQRQEVALTPHLRLWVLGLLAATSVLTGEVAAEAVVLRLRWEDDTTRRWRAERCVTEKSGGDEVVLTTDCLFEESATPAEGGQTTVSSVLLSCKGSVLDETGSTTTFDTEEAAPTTEAQEDGAVASEGDDGAALAILWKSLVGVPIVCTLHPDGRVAEVEEGRGLTNVELKLRERLSWLPEAAVDEGDSWQRTSSESLLKGILRLVRTTTYTVDKLIREEEKVRVSIRIKEKLHGEVLVSGDHVKFTGGSGEGTAEFDVTAGRLAVLEATTRMKLTLRGETRSIGIVRNLTEVEVPEPVEEEKR